METGGGSGLMLAVTTPLFLLDPRPSQDGGNKEHWIKDRNRLDTI